MVVRTKGPTNQAGKKERAVTDKPPSSDDAPLSVEDAARRAQDAYDKLALNKLELLDKMSERARTAYRAGTNVNVDKAADAGNTKAMNDISREEFNARMETIEVKMDARVESVSAKIDGFLAAQAERDKRLDESVANIRGDIARLGSLKLNIWGAMLTAVGIGIAVAALSVTFYQTGKADSPSTNSQQAAPVVPSPASPKQ